MERIDILARMCDHYCKFPNDKDLNQEQLEKICDNCPLNFLEINDETE